MNKLRCMWQVGVFLIVWTCVGALIACQIQAGTNEEQTSAGTGSVDPRPEQALVIENDSNLPDTYPQAPYLVRLTARGATSPLRWGVEKGALPPGIKLDNDGMLRGAAERSGEFQFTVSATDSGSPQQAVQKSFVIRVRSALSINWKSPAHVAGNRIEGSVEVTNTTPDDMELTFDVKAVAENGRATEIGYQHFVLRRGTIAKELPFGETLPHGGYVVHVNAVGEVAPKKLIYRDRLQTPGALQVTVGP